MLVLVPAEPVLPFDDSEAADGVVEAADSPGLASPPDPSPFAPAFVRLAAPRSFFAQPDPLKWIAGGANALRIVPSAPQAEQKSGPLSLTPWRMSVRWLQAEQTYS